MVNPVSASTRILEPLYGGKFRAEIGPPLDFVLPGELVAPDSLHILERSPVRVEPGCVHFGTCGGCHYQHAAPASQLHLKQQILSDLLQEARLPDLPAIALQSGPAWEYRNRIRLRVEPTASGFAVGYSRRASNDFLPIHMCPIAAPVLWRAAEALLACGGAWLPNLAEVEFFCAADESRLQARFFLRRPETAAARFTALCEALQARIPELAGAGAELSPDAERRVRRRWEGLAWGAPGLSYEAAGRRYWVARGAFFQVNRFLVDTLVNLVCGQQSGALAWDLFAGVGLFTRGLAERFAHVVAVEGAPEAAAALRAASRAGKDFEAVHAATLDFLRAREHQRERPDLLVLDPPRAGLGPDAAEVLARMGLPRMVYVSCDPVTLARDLAILERAYRIHALDLIDLFPQTFHLETVVHLSRR